MRMSPLETIINFNIFKIMRGERGECKGAIHVQQLITTVSSYLHFATDNQYPKFNWGHELQKMGREQEKNQHSALLWPLGQHYKHEFW